MAASRNVFNRGLAMKDGLSSGTIHIMHVDATFTRITFSNILIIHHSPSDYRPGTASVSGKCGFIGMANALPARPLATPMFERELATVLH